MIKAIILDVDGVIIGEKIGYNSPHPHHAVTEALKKVRQKGIPVCLCTAKPQYAIREEITRSQLNNPHITDAGAVIIDPIANSIVKKHILESKLVTNILEKLIHNGVYTEIYTVDDYFIQKDQKSDITKKHTHILQKEPVVLRDVIGVSKQYDVTKIMSIAKDSNDKKRVSALLNSCDTETSISWGIHPVALPLQFGIITGKGSSKKEGVEVVLKRLKIRFDEVLGIGDSTSDWKFIEFCGYGATVSNGTEELKKLLKTKKNKHYFIAKDSVDENGILEVFKYFSL